MVFIPSLPITSWGLEKGGTGSQEESRQGGPEGWGLTRLGPCTSGRIRALFSLHVKICLA